MAYTTIKKPSDYFNTVLNTGDNTSPKSITGFNFQPDLVWTKTRTTGNNHTLFDSVRGAGSGKEISSNSTAGEGSGTINTPTYGYLSSFDSDGFTATSGSSGINYFNESGSTYVNWGWLANGAGSANTDGTISSTVSANTTSGFSIVSWTGNGTSGANIGHSLGVAPSMIISKNRDNAENWFCYHKSLGATQYIRLNLTNTSGSATSIWNDTEPTSSVFTVGNDTAVNTNGVDYIAYCFAEKQGYSKFGSYTGNGSSDGTFVYTGFKPAWLLIKGTNVAASWRMVDNKRNTFNVMNKKLSPSSANAESTETICDFLSNGFKMKSTDAAINGSGNSFIYMAFAEEPLVGDNPATAR